jgi:hypothetical protein
MAIGQASPLALARYASVSCSITHRVILSMGSTHMERTRNIHMQARTHMQEDTHSIRRMGKLVPHKHQNLDPTPIHQRVDNAIHHDDPTHHDDGRPGLHRDQLMPDQRGGLTWRRQQPSASSTLPSASECNALFPAPRPAGPSKSYVPPARRILGLRNLMQPDQAIHAAFRSANHAGSLATRSIPVWGPWPTTARRSFWGFSFRVS